MQRQDKPRKRALLLMSVVLIGLVASINLAPSFSQFDEVWFGQSEPSAATEILQSPTGADNRVDTPPVPILTTKMTGRAGGYAHNWDDNPVAYIPESSMIKHVRGYAHNWDDNPVAYIPETSMVRNSGDYARYSPWPCTPFTPFATTALGLPLFELPQPDYSNRVGSRYC